jgi:hypothetical protein
MRAVQIRVLCPTIQEELSLNSLAFRVQIGFFKIGPLESGSRTDESFLFKSCFPLLSTNMFCGTQDKHSVQWDQTSFNGSLGGLPPGRGEAFAGGRTDQVWASQAFPPAWTDLLKTTWLAGDKHWRHHHPITFTFCLFARKKSLCISTCTTFDFGLFFTCSNAK